MMTTKKEIQRYSLVIVNSDLAFEPSDHNTRAFPTGASSFKYFHLHDLILLARETWNVFNSLGSVKIF